MELQAVAIVENQLLAHNGLNLLRRSIATDVMEVLKFTSCMAANADSACAAIAAYVGHRLSIPTQFVNQIDWQQRERSFDAGEIQVCWICGLPYVWKADPGWFHVSQ